MWNRIDCEGRNSQYISKPSAFGALFWLEWIEQSGGSESWFHLNFPGIVIGHCLGTTILSTYFLRMPDDATNDVRGSCFVRRTFVSRLRRLLYKCPRLTGSPIVSLQLAGETIQLTNLKRNPFIRTLRLIPLQTWPAPAVQPVPVTAFRTAPALRKHAPAVPVE